MIILLTVHQQAVLSHKLGSFIDEKYMWKEGTWLGKVGYIGDHRCCEDESRKENRLHD